MKDYEMNIGLEVHIELATNTKIFCGCSTEFGGRPNTHICPVCMAMPGSLPRLNKKVVEYAVAVGLATGCKINEYNRFDRKNYFYPDNPQNYQISQLYSPVCVNGEIVIDTDEGKKTIGIHEIHMEEDAGKLIHDDEKNISFVDYNRAGVPLIEVVSEPHMKNAGEVIAYLEKLRLICLYLGVSDCKLNEGSMRVDVNLSVREKGCDEMGTRTEMKNLNSLRSITRAIENEAKRQIEIIESGGSIYMETRRWDDNEGCSYAMRSKEEVRDYRYFPEPDLPPVILDNLWVLDIKKREPEFRDEKKLRYINEFGLPEYDANLITLDVNLAKLFEETTSICNKPKKVSNWLITEMMRLLKENEMDSKDIIISPENLALLIEITETKEINSSVAKEVFEIMFNENINPRYYIEKNDLKQQDNVEELSNVVKEVISNNEKSVNDYKNGKQNAIGFLVGQCMKATRGKGNPVILNKLLKEILDEI